MKEKATIIHISPTIAQRMLDSDTAVRETTKAKNRKLSVTHVNYLAKEMAAGRWVLTGSSIQFNELGELIDGQHRLVAIIRAGMTVPCYVVTGLPTQAFFALDQNKKRTTRDILHALEYKYDAYLGAAVLHILNWEGQKLFYKNRGQISSQEVVEWIDANPKIMDSAHMVLGSTTARTRQQGFKPGLLMALHFLFGQRNKGSATYFMEALSTGKFDLPSDDVIFLLRERLIRDAISKARLDSESLANFIVVAWNRWRDKEPLKSFKGVGKAEEIR